MSILSNNQAVWLGIANVNFNKNLEVEEYINSLFELVNYRTGEEITWEVPWAPAQEARSYLEAFSNQSINGLNNVKFSMASKWRCGLVECPID